jgi:hypothetical protein
MRKFIYGIIIGFILAIFFVVFGGGKYLERFGVQTEKAGKEIVKYEDELKDKIERAKSKVTTKTDDIKKGVIEKKDKVKKFVE